MEEADTVEQLELFLSPAESDFAGTVVTLGSGFTVIVTTDGAGAGEEAEALGEGEAEAVGKRAEEELGEAEADALPEEDTTVPETAESVLAEQDVTTRARAAPNAGRVKAVRPVKRRRVEDMDTPEDTRQRASVLVMKRIVNLSSIGKKWCARSVPSVTVELPTGIPARQLLQQSQRKRSIVVGNQLCGNSTR